MATRKNPFASGLAGLLGQAGAFSNQLGNAQSQFRRNDLLDSLQYMQQSRTAAEQELRMRIAEQQMHARQQQMQMDIERQMLMAKPPDIRISDTDNKLVIRDRDGADGLFTWRKHNCEKCGVAEGELHKAGCVQGIRAWLQDRVDEWLAPINSNLDAR